MLRSIKVPAVVSLQSFQKPRPPTASRIQKSTKTGSGSRSIGHVLPFRYELYSLMKFSVQFALFILLLTTHWWQEGDGRVLNKDTESLAQKLEKRDLKPDIHKIRARYTNHVERPDAVYSVDEQDALLFQYVILSILHGMQRSIRHLSTLIRVGGDTFAGVLSGVMKATGGLLSVAANVMWFLSSKLALPAENLPQVIGNLSTNCAYGLRNSANMLYGLSEACIWSGEILESVSLGLGEAVQDSFWGLEAVSQSSNLIVKFLLQIESTVNSTTAQLVPSAGMAANGSTSVSLSPVRVQQGDSEAETVEQSLRQEITRHSHSGILHHHQRHGERGITSSASTSSSINGGSSGRALEERLGKQWVVPWDLATEGEEEGEQATNSNIGQQRMESREDEKRQGGRRGVGTVFGAAQAASTGDSGQQGAETPGGADWRDWAKDVIEGAVTTIHYVVFELPERLGGLGLQLWQDANSYGDAVIAYTGELISQRVQAVTAHTWAALMDTVSAAALAQATADDTASQGLFLVLSLCAAVAIGTLPFRQLKWKVLTAAVFAAVVYLSFTATETVQRSRIASRAAVEATHNLLQRQAEQRSRRFAIEQARERTTGREYIASNRSSASTTARGPYGGGKGSTPEFEFDDAVWLNSAMSALWEVLDPQFGTGGLGPYISEMYADMVSTELAKVPPGVANVRLKRFELGHSAPLFKGVRVMRLRNQSCLDAALDSQQRPTAAEPHSSRTGGGWEATVLRQEGLLAQLVEYVRYSDALRGHPLLKPLLSSETQPSPSVHAGHSRHGHSSSSTSSSSSSSKHRLPFLEQFSAQCDRIVVEMDAVYASRDMGVELSLRSNDLQTLVPEVAVTLSEVHVAGQLRLNVSLTADYPFVGDGQLSFLRPPQLAFSISSFGGLELSSMPYAFQWVNSSMHWLLTQYTAPHFVPLDLRHTVCPSCDKALVPLSHTVREALRDTLEHVKGTLRRGRGQAMALAVHLRRLLVKAGLHYGRLSALGREHGGRLMVSLEVLGRGAVKAGKAVGEAAGTVLRRTALQIRSGMRGVPPLRSEALRGIVGAEDGEEEEESLHIAWYKGLDDLPDYYFQQQQEQEQPSTGLRGLQQRTASGNAWSGLLTHGKRGEERARRKQFLTASPLDSPNTVTEPPPPPPPPSDGETGASADSALLDVGPAEGQPTGQPAPPDPFSPAESPPATTSTSIDGALLLG